MSLPRRLAAPPSTWERDVDVVVLGSGAAGMSAALAAHQTRSVLVVTKDVVSADSGHSDDRGDSGDPDDRAGVDVMHQVFALDLLVGVGVDGADQVAGVRVARTDEHGVVRSVGTITARAVVMATGGYGQVFASTSTQPADTGDGIAMALRAGVAVRDLEFVEFHPTVLWRGPEALGQQTLVPDSVRSDGAILYDAAGDRIMIGDPLEDLAPRDVVSAAISDRMALAPGGVDDHVYLDATHLGERFHELFPSISEACREIGLDPATERIPVAPAAHSSRGGIVASPDGATALRGLYAVGAVAPTGAGNANGIDGDRLSESIAAGTRVGSYLARELPPAAWVMPDLGRDFGSHPQSDPLSDPALFDPIRLREVRAAMSRHVGVLRSASSLAAALGALGSIARQLEPGVEPSRRSWEATNLLTVGSAVVSSALARTESRGGHRRTDHPAPDPSWARPLLVSLDATGSIDVQPGPAAST